MRKLIVILFLTVSSSLYAQPYQETITYTDGEDNIGNIVLTPATDPTELTIASGTATQSTAIVENGVRALIDKTGAGTLLLTASSQLAGSLNVTAGTFSIQGAFVNVGVASQGTGFGVLVSSGTLTVLNGAVLNTYGGFAASAYGSTTPGVITVAGVNNGMASTWNNTGEIVIGAFNPSTPGDPTAVGGILNVQDGGQVSSPYVVVGATANGIVNVTGINSSGTASNLTVSNQLFVGGSTSGVLNIQNGAQVVSNTAYIANSNYYQSSTGTLLTTGGVTVSGTNPSGTGSSWTNSSTLYVGYDGTGTLTIGNGGQVSASSIVLANLASAQGTLNLNSGGLLSTGSIVVGSGTGTLNLDAGTIRAQGNSTNFIQGVATGPVLLSGAGTTFDNNGYNITLSVSLGGSGGLISTGAGTLTLTSANTYAGITSVNSGTMIVDGLGAGIGLGPVSSALSVGNNGSTGTLIIQNGAAVNVASASPSIVSTFIGDGTGSTGSVTVTGVNAGTASHLTSNGITVGNQGTGTLTVADGGLASSNNLYNTIVGNGSGSNGTVTVTGVNAGGAASTLLAGGVLYVGDGAGSTGTVTISNGGQVTTTVVALTTDSTGQATVNLESGGTLTANSVVAGFGGTAGNASLALDGGTLRASDGTSNFISGFSPGQVTVGRNGGTIDNNGNAIGINAPIGGVGQLTLTGSGVTTLGGANDFLGGLLITGGTVVVSSGANLGYDADTVTLNGGTLKNSTDLITIHNVALGANGGTIDSSGGYFTFNSTVSGTGGLAVTGNGLVTLGGAQTYTGATVIESGILKLTMNGINASTFASSSVDIASGATLSFEYSQTYAGSITGAGELVHSFNGFTTTLTGDVSNTGGTLIDGGTIQIGNGGTTGSITGSITDNGTLAFDRSDDVTFSGNISGSGSVSQMGGGTLTLSGSNNYAGGTTVTNGSVVVTGSINGALNINAGSFSVGSGGSLNGNATVGAGGVLGGKGTITGNVTVQSDGTLWPGDPSVTTTKGNVTLNSGSTAAFSITNTVTPDGPRKVTAGTDYDQVALQDNGAASNLTIQTGTTLQINSLQSLQFNSVAYVPSGPNTSLDNYFVFTLQSGTTTGKFDFLSDGTNTASIFYSNGIGTVTLDGVLLDISYTGNYATNSTLGGQDIVVTAYAATPEPGTWALLLSGLVGLGLYKRRHASRIL